MANRQRAEARRKAQAKAARSGDGEGGGMNKLYIWAALGLVLVLGVGIALFVGGDDSKSVTADSQTTVVSGLPDSQPRSSARRCRRSPTMARPTPPSVSTRR